MSAEPELHDPNDPNFCALPAEVWAALKAQPDQDRVATVAPIVGLDGKPLQPN